MRRLHFLVPDIATTKKIVDELLLARVECRRIHVLAKRGTPLDDLPEATFLQKTDFVPALGRGFATGGVTGALAGLIAMALPGPALGGAVVLAAAAAGAGLGTLASSMIGAGAGSRRLRAYEEAIENGKVLVMADVATGRVAEIEGLIRRHHAETECCGVEPTIPAFP